MRVTIPEDTSPSDYRFTLVADREYSIATQRLMVNVMAAEPVPYDVRLYSPLDWQVTYPDSYLTFCLRVKNLAPESRDCLVYVDSPLPENWTSISTWGRRRPNRSARFPKRMSLWLWGLVFPKRRRQGITSSESR